jgi:hypothetical protein
MTRGVEKPEGTCVFGVCDKKAIGGGRCGKHHRFVPKRSEKFGGENYEKVVRVPFPGTGDDPREWLVEALAAGMEGPSAATVVDALDAYLATDPAERGPALQWTPHNYRADLDEANRKIEELRAELQGEPEPEPEPADTVAQPPAPEPEPLPSTEPSAKTVAHWVDAVLRAVRRRVRSAIHALDARLGDG